MRSAPLTRTFIADCLEFRPLFPVGPARRVCHIPPECVHERRVLRKAAQVHACRPLVVRLVVALRGVLVVEGPAGRAPTVDKILARFDRDSRYTHSREAEMIRPVEGTGLG